MRLVSIPSRFQMEMRLGIDSNVRLEQAQHKTKKPQIRHTQFYESRFVFEAKTIQKMELLVLSFRFNFTFLTCKAVARSRIWKEEISYAFCT
ncbi:hypothetical protein LXL04_014954 [Taraxacum kok-saghyz]